MGEVIHATDELFRPVISDAKKQQIRTAFDSLPARKKAAILVLADLDGNATATVAAKLGKHWKVAAGAGWQLGDKRPSGYVGIEGSF